MMECWNIGMLGDEKELIRFLEQQLSHQTVSDSGIMRICIPIESVDPLAWLKCQTLRPHWFWQGRGQNTWVAGAGLTHGVEDDQTQNLDQAMMEMERVLAQSDEGVRYFGGMAFDQRANQTDEWQAFGRFYFFVPRVLLEGDPEQIRLVLQVPRNETVTLDSLLSELQDVTGPVEALDDLGPGSVESDIQEPDHASWCHMVSEVLESLEDAPNKLVPACCRRMIAQQDLDPHAILATLRGRGDAYQFYLGLEHSAFLGRSPELLYSRDGRKLTSEALAGTSARPQSKALWSSLKENHEQNIVVRDVQEAMDLICDRTRMSRTKELARWGSLAHLKTSMVGRLKPEVNDSAILQALHPTAAVLGYPRPWAWEQLSQVESLQRGWYAGPIGWIGREQAEFCVAIRSALCRAKTLAIYAGAGIVKGSDPEQEWIEVRNKMRPYVDLFVK